MWNYFKLSNVEKRDFETVFFYSVNRQFEWNEFQLLAAASTFIFPQIQLLDKRGDPPPPVIDPDDVITNDVGGRDRKCGWPAPLVDQQQALWRH